MLALLFAVLAQEGMANQAQLREDFAREFKDKNPSKRIEALRYLIGLTEDKTLVAICDGLRDADVQVRKTAADVIYSCTDVHGAAIKPLCRSLLDRKEHPEVRTACARALLRAQYKAEAVDALIQVLAGIGEQEKDLKELRAECLQSVKYLSAQELGAAAEPWKKWWTENKARLLKEDKEKLAYVLKQAPPKK